MNQRDSRLELKMSKIIATNRILRKRLSIVRKKLRQREMGYAALVETNVSLVKQLGDIKFINDFKNYHKSIQDNINSISMERERKEKDAISYALNIQTKLSDMIQSFNMLSKELIEAKNQTGTYLNSLSTNHKSDLNIYEPSSSIEPSLNNSNIPNTCINGYCTPIEKIQNEHLKLTPPIQNQILPDKNKKITSLQEPKGSLEEQVEKSLLPQKELPIEEDNFVKESSKITSTEDPLSLFPINVKELDETPETEDPSEFFPGEDGKSITDTGHSLLSDSSPDESDVESVTALNQTRDNEDELQQELDSKELAKTPPFRRFPIPDHDYAMQEFKQCCILNGTYDEELLRSPVIDSRIIHKLSDIFIDEELQSEFANKIKQEDLKRKINSFSETIEKKLCSDPIYVSDMNIKLTPLRDIQENSMNSLKVQEKNSEPLELKNLSSGRINPSKKNVGLRPVKEMQEEENSSEIKNLFSELIYPSKNNFESRPMREMQEESMDSLSVENSDSSEIKTNGSRSPVQEDSEDIDIKKVFSLSDKLENSNIIFHTYVEKKKLRASNRRPHRELLNIYTSPDQKKEFNLYNLKSSKKRRNKNMCSTHSEFLYNSNDPYNNEGFCGFRETSLTSAMHDRHKLLRYLRKIKRPINL